MKRQLFVISCGLLIFALVGCALFRKPKPVISDTAGRNRDLFSAYTGPKARITVADFEVKAAKATSDVGLGLRQMLINALIDSNRFSVIERQAAGEAIQQQDLSASGAAQPADEPQKSKINTADLIITAAVTEFEPQASGGRAGIGGGGGAGSGILGGLLGTALNKAHLTLDIRIIDASTSEVLAATRVQGQASDIGGGIKPDFFGSCSLDSGLSIYANAPMEKAIHICIAEAVRYIWQTIPGTYYNKGAPVVVGSAQTQN